MHLHAELFSGCSQHSSSRAESALGRSRPESEPRSRAENTRDSTGFICGLYEAVAMRSHMRSHATRERNSSKITRDASFTSSGTSLKLLYSHFEVSLKNHSRVSRVFNRCSLLSFSFCRDLRRIGEHRGEFSLCTALPGYPVYFESELIDYGTTAQLSLKRTC